MMARKKYHLPPGEGTFFQRKDGRWVGEVEAGWSERGTRKRVTVSSMDKDKAWDKLTVLRKRRAQGEQVGGSVPTVKVWADRWLELQRQHLRPQSHAQVESRLKRWIVPALGHKRLDRVTPADVRSVGEAVVAAGRSTSTARAAVATLTAMLRDAVADGHPVPPATLLTKRPRAAISDREAIPPEMAVKLVAVAASRPNGEGARWVAALLQGMRQGECLGLTWQAIDWKARTLDVSWQLVQLKYADKAAKAFRVPSDYEVRQVSGGWHLARPKSRSGQRIIPLVPWMLEALELWRRHAPENRWGLVWPRADGKGPRTPDMDRLDWRALCDEAEVWKAPGVAGGDPVRFVPHEARHSAASLLLAAGVNIEVVRQIMGHSSVAMSRHYIHASPENLRQALSAAAGILQLPE